MPSDRCPRCGDVNFRRCILLCDDQPSGFTQTHDCQMRELTRHRATLSKLRAAVERPDPPGEGCDLAAYPDCACECGSCAVNRERLRLLAVLDRDDR